MEISIHRWFQVPREPRERATYIYKPVEFHLVFIFQTTMAENAWPPRSKSAHSQVSAALFYVRTIRPSGHGSVQTIHRLLACKQRVSDVLSQSKHWSGSQLVCRTCSAAPAWACFPSETFYDLFLLFFFFFVMLFRNGKREERWEGRPRGMMHGQLFCSHKTKNHKLKCFCEIVNPYITLLYLGGGGINPLLTSCGLLLPSVNQFTPTNSH